MSAELEMLIVAVAAAAPLVSSVLSSVAKLKKKSGAPQIKVRADPRVEISDIEKSTPAPPPALSKDLPAPGAPAPAPKISILELKPPRTTIGPVETGRPPPAAEAFPPREFKLEPQPRFLIEALRPEAGDHQVDVRLPEITEELDAEEGRKKLYRYSAGSLVAGQFVVGGLLASSFVADNLSRALIGILGLLVLTSSLVNHHFRPDLLYKAAIARTIALRRLKRTVEDELFEIRRGPPDKMPERIVAVRKKVSAVLDEIDASELSFLDEFEKTQNADERRQKGAKKR